MGGMPFIDESQMDDWREDPSATVIHAPAGSYAAKIAQETGYALVIEEP